MSEERLKSPFPPQEKVVRKTCAKHNRMLPSLARVETLTDR
jgi:hypothetical protein